MAKAKAAKKTAAAASGDSFDIENFEGSTSPVVSRKARIAELRAELKELLSNKPKLSGKKKTVRVQATRLGFDGLRRRKPGSVFNLTLPVEYDLPSWCRVPKKGKAAEEESEETPKRIPGSGNTAGEDDGEKEEL